MGSALSISTNFKMGPVVAALGAIAAGTLVAATILGQSLGPIPVDQPAIAMQPGEGVGNPLVVEISSDALPADPQLSGVLAALAPEPAPLGAADDLFPNKSAADRTPTTTIIEEERVEPVPPNEDLLSQVHRRVAEIVKAEIPVPVHASIVDDTISQPRSKKMANKGERHPKRAEPPATSRPTTSEPAPSGGGTVDAEETTSVKAGVKVVEEALAPIKETPTPNLAQEAPPTAAGPASPAL